MQRPRNSRSALDLFSGFDQTIREYVIERPRAQWHALKGKFDNLPETNFKLGCEFAERGQYFDASLRFKFALYLQPGYAQAHYNLASCYLQMNKQPQAMAEFKKTLQLDPTHRQFCRPRRGGGSTGGIRLRQ
jgi:tetratricopeptide (TPR) repeat protein